MKNLSVLEMKEMVGGGVSLWGILGIGSLLTFLAGIIDGIARPLKCH